MDVIDGIVRKRMLSARSGVEAESPKRGVPGNVPGVEVVQVAGRGVDWRRASAEADGLSRTSVQARTAPSCSSSTTPSERLLGQRCARDERYTNSMLRVEKGS